MAAAPSAARLALAAAVTAHQEAKREFAALHQANRAADEAVHEAWNRREAAIAAVERAKIDAVTHLATGIMSGNAGPAPVSVQTVRTALQAAEDHHTAVTAARVRIAADLEAAQNSPGFRELLVNNALRAVLAAEATPAAAKLAKELAALQHQLADKATALNVLLRAGAGADDAELKAIDGRFNTPPSAWDVTLAPDASPTATRWRAVVAALRTDAAAALPA
jgi:hypothetical protein